MEQPVRASGSPAHQDCALCGKPIKTTDDKMTVQGRPYHARCWERAAVQKRREPQRST